MSSFKRWGRQAINHQVRDRIVFSLGALVTLVLAGFALGSFQPPAHEINQMADARGNLVSGLYNPGIDAFEGPTQIIFPDSGVFYEGGFEGNRFNGQGVFRGEDVTEEGEVLAWRFEGVFIQGRLEGHGSYSDHLGSYEGTFKDSLPNGRGVYTSNSGWRYDGEFLAGTMTGYGTVYLADGTSSSGRFEDGLQVASD